MFIYPNSTIKVLKDVPLDPTFDHTIYFSTVNDQVNYFNTKVKQLSGYSFVFNNQTYQRVKRGWMRLQMPSELLYDCNYIMFQNTAFGTKWFYAFLTAVEYVNNNVSEVRFQIDPMQTWHFDYTLQECFVEREHSASDGFNNWNIEEGIDFGDEYIMRGTPVVYNMNSQKLCILSPRVIQGDQGPTLNIGNIIVPMRINAEMDVSVNTTTINQWFNDFTDVENIEMVYQYPSRLFNVQHQPKLENINMSPNFTVTTQSITDEEGTRTYQRVNGTFVSDDIEQNYTPRNAKLFCYPYNFILATNHSGETAVYRWEDWNAAQFRGYFGVYGTYVSTPEVLLFPHNYRGISDDWDSGLVYDAFPQCAWSGDAFRSWWAQKAGSKAGGILAEITSGGGIVKAALEPVYSTSGMDATTYAPNNSNLPKQLENTAAYGLAATTAISVGTSEVGKSLLGKIIPAFKQMRDARFAPNQLHGQTQTNSLNNAIGKCQFTLYYCGIKRQYLKALDDFFDRFGYSSKSNKVPYRAIRPYWTYTKTAGCTIDGSLPQDDAKFICELYDRGITFWKYVAGRELKVGDYSQDNRATH